MKIAFLSFYSGVVFRGVETYVHELANRLEQLGHGVSVFQGGKDLPGAKYKTITIPVGVDWQKKGSYTPFFNYYAMRVKKFTSEAIRKIDKETDIIFPTNGQWQSLLCSVWAKTHGKRIVISGQSGPGMDDKVNIWTFPNVFVGLTDFQRSWAKKSNIFVKVTKIPNGVDLSKFDIKGKAVNLELPSPIILCASALQDWKRLDLAIRAVAGLEKGSLVLVGKGEQKESLEKLGKELLPGRFEIMSFAHREMPTIYRSADIFTFPTVPWESFGIVLVEAMASGLPVVTTDDPIRREIVGDAGILVDPTNTDNYAAALKKALSTDWDNKPRKQAEKFAWDKIAEQYENLFEQILK